MVLKRSGGDRVVSFFRKKFVFFKDSYQLAWAAFVRDPNWISFFSFGLFGPLYLIESIFIYGKWFDVFRANQTMASLVQWRESLPFAFDIFGIAVFILVPIVVQFLFLLQIRGQKARLSDAFFILKRIHRFLVVKIFFVVTALLLIQLGLKIFLYVVPLFEWLGIDPASGYLFSGVFLAFFFYSRFIFATLAILDHTPSTWRGLVKSWQMIRGRIFFAWIWAILYFCCLAVAPIVPLLGGPLLVLVFSGLTAAFYVKIQDEAEVSKSPSRS